MNEGASRKPTGARGAALFRVHDVAPHVEALTVAAAVERGRVA